MANTEAYDNDSKAHDPTDSSEVTFHVARRSYSQPFRWVAAITTPEGHWEHWGGKQELDPEEVEELTVDLPSGMSQELLDFAHKHIGPNATEQQVDYWCHTFAHAVGATALQVAPSTYGGGEPGHADAKAQLLFEHGTAIPPSELNVGEHAAVADADPKAPHLIHSMVGIGRPKGNPTGPVLAVQVDTSKGALYIGEPGEYVDDYKKSKEYTRPTSQPQLYVQRTPIEVSARREERKRT